MSKIFVNFTKKSGVNFVRFIQFYGKMRKNIDCLSEMW